MHNNNQIPLQELRDIAEISARSFNVCIREKLDTIQDLHDFLDKNEDFLGINGCGSLAVKVVPNQRTNFEM